MAKKKQNPWHRWFADMFRLPPEPLGVEVFTDCPVMSDPPEADIVVIGKGRQEWTPEQLRFVPDGLRESRASHIIIEFKYTESLSEDAFLRTAGLLSSP